MLSNFFKRKRQQSIFTVQQTTPTTTTSPQSPSGSSSSANRHHNHHHRQSVIISGLSASIKELEQLVKLPQSRSSSQSSPPYDEKDWLAEHAVEFYENLFLLIDSTKLNHDCTEANCPLMSGGDCYEYRWFDDESSNVQYHQPTSVCAPLYINLLSEWIDSKLEDPKVFPQDDKQPYPKKFKPIVVKIFSRLFRVFAHIYHRHGSYINNLGISAHINTLFKHFVLFTLEWDLMQKAEYGPCMNVLCKLFGEDYAKKKFQ